MGETKSSDYINEEAVRAEIAFTRRLFERYDWPTIDVTRRSIEETAAADPEFSWPSADPPYERCSAHPGFHQRKPARMLEDAGVAVHWGRRPTSMKSLMKDCSRAVARTPAALRTPLRKPKPLRSANATRCAGLRRQIRFRQRGADFQQGDRRKRGARDSARAERDGEHELISAAVMAKDGAAIWRGTESASLRMRDFSARISRELSDRRNSRDIRLGGVLSHRGARRAALLRSDRRSILHSGAAADCGALGFARLGGAFAVSAGKLAASSAGR